MFSKLSFVFQGPQISEQEVRKANFFPLLLNVLDITLLDHRLGRLQPTCITHQFLTNREQIYESMFHKSLFMPTPIFLYFVGLYLFC